MRFIRCNQFERRIQKEYEYFRSRTDDEKTDF